MKIIETRSAPNPRRVRIFLAEKGVEVDFEEVDLMSGALRTADFTALNPLQRVPVLVLDDGTAIAESVAICRYFEELYPEPALFGRGPKGRALVEMWNRRIEHALLLPVAYVFRHLHPKMAHLEQPQIPAWGEANRPKVFEFLQLLDRHLEHSRYVVGDEPSIADITAMVAVDFMKPAKLELPRGLARLERWHQELRARPSARA